MKDMQWAGLVCVVFFVVVAARLRFPFMLNALSAVSRQGATVLLLGIIALVFHKGYPITSVVLSVLVVFLLHTLWSGWPRSDEKRLNLEVGRDLARFEEANSIDLQFANGSVKHNMPHLLAPPNAFNELLIFPPTSETLHEMCG
jgi:hypothetical protein